MNTTDLTAPKTAFPVVTSLLLVANLAVFLGDVYFGMDWLKPDLDVILELGANYAPLTLTGDSWRLLSSMFMHLGVQHLAVNMYMLVVIGMVAERSFARLPFFVVYLVSGVGGALTSALWYGYYHAKGMQMLGGVIVPTVGLQPVISVGASGALMGIAGACLAARVVEHTMIEPSRHVLTGSGKAIAQVIAINLVIGFVISGIDQAAHIGGLVVGMLVGGLLFALRSAIGARQLWLSMAVGVAALGGAVAIARTGTSDELQELRADFEEHASVRAAERNEEARLRAQVSANSKRREEIEKIAESDAREMPAPVTADVAAGVQVDLKDGNPWAFAVSANGRHLYATYGQENLVKVIDLERRAIVRVIHGPELPIDKDSGCPPSNNLCRGVGASGIAISRDEQLAYITSMVPDALSIIDLTSDKVVASISVGAFPRKVMLSDDERLAFVMNSVDNSYSVVDLTTRKVLSPPLSLKGGSAESVSFGRPLSTWMSPNGTTAYFFDAIGKTVAAFDVRNRNAQPDLAIGDFEPKGILPLDDQTWLLFADYALALHDVKTGGNRVEFQTCGSQTTKIDSALSPDGSMLAVADYRGFIHLVKLATGKTVGLYPARQPRSMSFSTDGRLVYVLTNETQLSILDVAKSLDVKQDVEGFGELYCLPET